VLAMCVCPAGGSGPGLRCLPRWGTAGAEWEGGVGGKCGLSCESALRSLREATRSESPLPASILRNFIMRIVYIPENYRQERQR